MTRIIKLSSPAQILFPTQVIGSMPRLDFVKNLLNNHYNHNNYNNNSNNNENNNNNNDNNNQLTNAQSLVIQLQEQAGVDIISDGEWTRLSYMSVIADLLHGFTREKKDGVYVHTITERLSWKQKGLFVREALFLSSITKKKIKIAIPSPYLIGSRMWDENKSKSAYLSKKEFMLDLAGYLRQELLELAKTNISTVQIDDPNLCLFVDPQHRKKFKNPEHECDFVVELINKMIQGINSFEIALHLCRSSGTRNRKLSNSTVKGFVAEGTYAFIIPFLKKLKVHQLAMEFAIPDARDFSVLAELPSHFKIGLGCVDCRPTVFNTAEEIAAIVEEALKFVNKERIILNPDCGFAPSSDAPVTLDQAYLKLKEMVKAAKILRDKYG